MIKFSVIFKQDHTIDNKLLYQTKNSIFIEYFEANCINQMIFKDAIILSSLELSEYIAEITNIIQAGMRNTTKQFESSQNFYEAEKKELNK